MSIKLVVPVVVLAASLSSLRAEAQCYSSWEGNRVANTVVGYAADQYLVFWSGDSNRVATVGLDGTVLAGRSILRRPADQIISGQRSHLLTHIADEQVFLAMVNEYGEPIAEDIQIEPTRGSGVDAVASADGSSFVVASTRSLNNSTFLISVRTIDGQGQLSPRIEVGSGTDWTFNKPQVVRTGDVLWVLWDSSDQVVGVRTDRSGRVLDDSPIVVADGWSLQNSASRGESAALLVHPVDGSLSELNSAFLTADGLVESPQPIGVDRFNERILFSPVADGYVGYLAPSRDSQLGGTVQGFSLTANAFARGRQLPTVECGSPALATTERGGVMACVREWGSGEDGASVMMLRSATTEADLGTPVEVDETELTRDEQECPIECSAGGGRGGASLVLLALGLIGFRGRRRKKRSGGQ